MEYNSPFRLSVDEYHRDIDINDAYREQVALYIHNVTAQKYPLELCRKEVDEMLAPGGELSTESPLCKMWVRNQKTGDREEKYTTVDKLFKTVIDKQIISAPSLTFYIPEHIKRSKLSEFTAANVAKRAAVKKEMFAAEAAGNRVLQINKKNEQNAVKTLNNGM